MFPERPTCGERTDMLANLKDKFHEQPSGIGITGNGGVVELLTSETGTWTLMLSFPNGRSCLMAVGENWEQAPAKPKGRDS